MPRSRRPGDPSARAERSVNLDVGETIVIDQWNSDGTATVKYRGTTWTAIHRPGVIPSTPAGNA
jgi:membrane protein implicated in regulation of membrane protease activity